MPDQDRVLVLQSLLQLVRWTEQTEARLAAIHDLNPHLGAEQMRVAFEEERQRLQRCLVDIAVAARRPTIH